MSLFLHKISEYSTLDLQKKERAMGRETVQRICCSFHSRHQGESNHIAWVSAVVDLHLVILFNTYKRRCITPVWLLCQVHDWRCNLWLKMFAGDQQWRWEEASCCDVTWTKVMWNSCWRGSRASCTNPSTREAVTFTISPAGLYLMT